MTTWRDAPDASGLWWVRREGQPDDVLQVDVDADGVWINRGGEGWCSVAEYDGARWCRVVTPERVEALESALRDVCESHRSRMDPDDDNWCRHCGAHWIHEAHGHGCPVGRALAVLRGTTVAGERGSRG